MPEDKKWEIADAADMIVSGFAFKRCGETIQIVNLNKNEPHVMIISPSGKMYMPSYVQFPYSDEVTIKVREFERRPNAEFREGDGVCGEGEAVKLIILI